MKKYAKVVNKETKLCDVGLGTNTEYYKKIGMKEQEVEQSYKGDWYLKGYAPQEPENNKIQKQIIELENSVQSRWLRNAPLGDKYSIKKLQEIEDKISVLRSQIK